MGVSTIEAADSLDIKFDDIPVEVLTHIDKVPETIPVEYNMAQDIDQKLYKLSGGQVAKERGGYYHPSSLGYCLRAAAYQRLGVPAKPKGGLDLYLNVELGSAMHHAMEGILKKVFPDVQVEVPVEDELLHIRGHADGVLPDRVIEFKTIKDEPQGPKPAHLIQVTVYQFLLQKPYWSILYYVKSKSKLVSFDGNFNKDLWKKIATTLIWIEQLLQRHRLPPREENYIICKTCSWRYICSQTWPNLEVF